MTLRLLVYQCVEPGVGSKGVGREIQRSGGGIVIPISRGRKPQLHEKERDYLIID